MSDQVESCGCGELHPVHRRRLFVGSCLSLVSTSVAFGVFTSLMGDLKTVFALTNTEVGWIGGATMWGFTISIFVFGPLCDAIGMRRLLRVAFLGHFVGPLLMMISPQCDKLFENAAFWVLFAGGLIIALANGTVEAVCNPLVATIYPDQKTHKLNQFHVWFPGGIVIGGLAAFFIDKIPADSWGDFVLASWQVKLALILVPTVIYGILFTGQKFPATERVQSGLSFGDMVRATLLRPLFIILFICMSLTASLELGPGRWMAEVMGTVMEKIGGANAGILVLVYGSVLMAVLRFFSGPVVHRLSPTGLLVCSAILGGSGLYILTRVESSLAIFMAATVFYVGVCYFWPTMLGVASERIPKGGALALALLGGWGTAVVGLVTIPAMGAITDHYGYARLEAGATTACLAKGVMELPAVKASGNAEAIRNIDDAIETVQSVHAQAIGGELPRKETAKALRFIVKYAPTSEAGRQAAELLKPADDFGGLMSFRWVASVSIVLVVVFGMMYLQDRSRGGYKIEKLSAQTEA